MSADDLRALAESATPGEWRVGQPAIDGTPYPVRSIVPVHGMTDVVARPTLERDAAYIAAASPNVVLALLDEIDALLSERDALRTRVGELEADLSAIYGRMRHTHPDDVSCAKAGSKGHPPHALQPAIGWGHSGPCARPDCDCSLNTSARALAASDAGEGGL